MWIRVKAPKERVNLSIPVPLGLAETVVRLIPESVLAQGRENMPEELRGLLTKKTICHLLNTCKHCLKGYKGLELIHVESADGEIVSITV